MMHGRSILLLGSAMLFLLSGLPGRAAAMETRPLLYSLLLPGLGEWSLGYKERAIGHFVIEAGSWAGNFYYRDKGFDLRHDYEAYAEEHWEVARWASAYSEAQPEWMDWLQPGEWEAYAWDATRPTAVEFDTTHIGYLQSHYAPYHEDPQHYYENLGKYDWYRWGWDDYSDASDDSVNRYVYGDIRNRSNDAFGRAHDFLSLMVLARVVSLADTFILLRRIEAGATRTELDQSWRMELLPGDPREASFRLAFTRRW